MCEQYYIGPCGVLVLIGTIHSNNEFNRIELNILHSRQHINRHPHELSVTVSLVNVNYSILYIV